MSMNEKQKHIKELLIELTEMLLENQLELDKIPTENCDLEPYEGSPVEDLVNCSYMSGKKIIIEEIMEILMVDFSSKGSELDVFNN